MDTKGDGEEMTYPHICFMVDNFDEVFCDIVVRDGEMVCVELVARGRGGGAGGGGAQAVIFLGSIRYDALTRVYDSRQSSLSTKVAQRMSFGLLGGKAAARCEFVRMKGPCGKGHAEMAVSKPRGAGADTPSSEPGLCATDLWDSDWEDDPEEMFVYRHQRRLSDPSANLNNFARSGGGLRAREGATSRSEDAGLDSLVAGIAEVDAGDLRDVERRSLASSAPALRPAPARAAPPRPAPAATPPSPRPLDIKLTPTRKHKPNEPKQDDNECEVADDAGSLDEKDFSRTQNKTIHSNSESTVVRGREELPCYRELLVYNAMRKTSEDTNGNEAGGAGGNREGAGGAGAALHRRARLPPRRTTPDGTDIYYWCDVPKRKWGELDDGAYNPLWAMRGFTQTFHLWKEGRRAQCTPLHAYLTYVTLPWWSIAKDILDIREEPILTF